MDAFMKYWSTVNDILAKRKLPNATFGQINDCWKLWAQDPIQAADSIEKEYEAEAPPPEAA